MLPQKFLTAPAGSTAIRRVAQCRMMYSEKSPSLLAVAVAALVCTAGASASKHYPKNGKKMVEKKVVEAELQLDLARVPQPVQRAEFPLEGDDSAFKFNFVEVVRS